MWHLTREEYEVRLNKIKQDNESRELKQKLKAEKQKYKQRSKVETSKLIAIYLFALFNVILCYALVAMWVFQDLSYLSVLITDVAAQILLYGIYCLKAYNSKKQEEQMKFEKEKLFGIIDENSIEPTLTDTEIVG